MKPLKDSQLKILRTFELPASAVRIKDKCVVNVYSEHGPLLVTRVVGCDGCEFRITHAATGLAFGLFETLKAARACAKELRGLEGWELTDPAAIVDKLRASVLPIVHRHGEFR